MSDKKEDNFEKYSQEFVDFIKTIGEGFEIDGIKHRYDLTIINKEKFIEANSTDKLNILYNNLNGFDKPTEDGRNKTKKVSLTTLEKISGQRKLVEDIRKSPAIESVREKNKYFQFPFFMLMPKLVEAFQNSLSPKGITEFNSKKVINYFLYLISSNFYSGNGIETDTRLCVSGFSQKKNYNKKLTREQVRELLDACVRMGFLEYNAYSIGEREFIKFHFNWFAIEIFARDVQIFWYKSYSEYLKQKKNKENKQYALKRNDQKVEASKGTEVVQMEIIEVNEPELCEIMEELSLGLEIDPLDIFEPEYTNEFDPEDKFEPREEKVVQPVKEKKTRDVFVMKAMTDESGFITDSDASKLKPSIYEIRYLQKCIAELQVLNFKDNNILMREYDSNECVPPNSQISIYKKEIA